MAYMDMTLTAKPRISDFQQAVVDRAMRFVAISATFQNRRMFPQKRPSPLGVAGVTIFVDAGLPELRRIRASVRIVAVGTDHFPFSKRHVRRTQ